jgi:hypothetical protein
LFLPVAAGFLFMGLACAIRNPQSPFQLGPELTELTAPSSIHLRSDSTLVVNVRVKESPGTGGVASVHSLFVPEGSSIPLWSAAMQDSGFSGDLIAKDGVYTVRLDSACFFLRPGSMRIGVTANDFSGLGSDTLWASSVVADDKRNAPPVLVEATVRDTLRMTQQSGLVTLVARAEDPDGLNDIDSIWAEVFPPLAASPRFTIRLNPTDVPGQYRGDGYPSVFYPSRPTLSAESLPDEVYRSDSTPIVLAVKVPDSSIIPLSVYFRTTKPDTTQNGPFLMFDDGNQSLHGDQTAGDRIYSLIITITSANQLGDYRFDFYADTGADQSGAWLFRFMAADKGGLKSLPVVREMNVERDSAPMPALTHTITVKDGNESL